MGENVSNSLNTAVHLAVRLWGPISGDLECQVFFATSRSFTIETCRLHEKEDIVLQMYSVQKYLRYFWCRSSQELLKCHCMSM